MARTWTIRTRAERLAPAAQANYSDKSLIVASGVDASALLIARRHDPYLVAGSAARDREAALFAARLERPETLHLRAGLQKAALTAISNPAARPFRMADALDASRDLDCLTQAVYFEARGEGLTGMQAVAQVVLNRVRHPAFPKTVCGVVFQGAAQHGCQFSFACDGVQHRNQDAAWTRSRQVAARALAGYVMAQVGNATHFHTTAVAPGWDGMLRVAQIGSHVFYRFAGHAGQPNAFRHAAQPSTENDVSPTVLAGFAPPPTPDAATPAPAPMVMQLTQKPAEKAVASPVATPAPTGPAGPNEAPKA